MDIKRESRLMKISKAKVLCTVFYQALLCFVRTERAGIRTASGIVSYIA